jgi:hypothetical protein
MYAAAAVAYQEIHHGLHRERLIGAQINLAGNHGQCGPSSPQVSWVVDRGSPSARQSNRIIIVSNNAGAIFGYCFLERGCFRSLG